MSSEPWVEFRVHIFSFEDLMNSWGKKLKGRVRDAVHDFIAREVKDNLTLWPTIRKVRLLHSTPTLRLTPCAD